MKNSILFFLFLLLLINTICYSQSPTIQTVIDQTNLDSLTTFVEELSGNVSTIIGGTPYTILSRNKYYPGNDKAADYIEQKLEFYGLEVHNQTFGSVGRNVFGIQPGTDYPNQKLIICAHYDDMPSGSIAPGADDNASGTAAVLEAARVLTQYNSEYTIIYALWDEEEYGLIGAEYYANLAQSAGDSIVGVVNLDMVAWDSGTDNIAEVHTRNVANSNELKDQMLEVNSLYNIGLVLQTVNPGTGSSDQAAFWNEGYGAILLIEDWQDFNDFYHTTNDLVAHFNLPYYLKMSQAAIGTIATLANISEATVPVELVSFSGTAMQDKIKLSWTTASELNNLGFEVERTTNNSNWRVIGFVDGYGYSNSPKHYSLVDIDINQSGTYYYRLKQIDNDGTIEYLGIVAVEVGVPNSLYLSQNYPNPFNPSTKIEFALPYNSFVDLKVYNPMGEIIAVLVNEQKNAGRYEITFNASPFPSGVYFYSLKVGAFVITKKILLTK